MAQCIGAQASLKDQRYQDIRSGTSQQPYEYITKMPPSGTCPPKDLPYTCGWNEGGNHVSSENLRVGVGLTRERGAIKPNAQLVGPVLFQKGNGDIDQTDEGTRLRNGTPRQVLRGTHLYAPLKGCVPFQQGQVPWTSFQSTAERGRNKYGMSVNCSADYLTEYAPKRPLAVEPFVISGIDTRQGKDF